MPDTTFPFPVDVLATLLKPYLEQAVEEYFKQLPAPDPWLTIPEAAAYSKLTDKYMALLVLGRPYRAAANGKLERAAMARKIPAGDTGFTRGARVRQSAVDTYLMRHSYRQ